MSATRRDPRYRRKKFIDLKLDALRRGILKNRRRATVVGVGESLERGCRALRLLGLHVDDVHCGRPAPRVLEALRPPVVLLFMAPSARERWRVALRDIGMTERTEFVFVA